MNISSGAVSVEARFHDPLVCGLGRHTDCAACRLAEDRRARDLAESEQSRHQERVERDWLANLGPREVVRGALLELLAPDIADIAAAVAREVAK